MKHTGGMVAGVVLVLAVGVGAWLFMAARDNPRNQGWNQPLRPARITFTGIRLGYVAGGRSSPQFSRDLLMAGGTRWPLSSASAQNLLSAMNKLEQQGKLRWNLTLQERTGWLGTQYQSLTIRLTQPESFTVCTQPGGREGAEALVPCSPDALPTEGYPDAP